MRRCIVWLLTCLLVLAGSSALCAADAPAAGPLERLARLGPIVYVTAHPDDESGPVLTYLARGLGARVVLLCLTRGEGGQNQIGPELDEELAAVRVQELERAAAGYGAEVRFLGAVDFGYSKSVEETLARWGEEKILGELVRQVRELHPLVVISRWSPAAAPASAHHHAAGLLARRAFEQAGDPSAFAEQLRHGYQPWQPRYFVVHTSATDPVRTIEVPVDDASPVAGKTYADLGWQAFRAHRSQGLDRIERPRWRPYFLHVEAVRPEDVTHRPTRAADLAPSLTALPGLFPSVKFPARAAAQLEDAVVLTQRAARLLEEQKPAEAALHLVQCAGLVAALLREIPADEADREASGLRTLLAERQNEFLQAAARLARVEFDALTDRATLTPIEQVWVGLAVRVGAPDVFQHAGFELGSLELRTPPDWGVEPAAAETTPLARRAEFLVRVPETVDPTQASAPPLTARATLTTGSLVLHLTAPVRGLAASAAERSGLLERLDPRRLFRRTEPPAGAEPAQLEPVTLAPPLTLAVEPSLRLLAARPAEATHEWCVRLEAHRPNLGKVTVWLDVPSGWYSPLPQEADLSAATTARRCFAVTAPAGLKPGRYTIAAAAKWGSETYRRARQAVPGSPARYAYEPARGHVEALDLKVPPALRIGYIGFNDDPVPMLLAQLGLGVDLLDVAVLATARLADYDTIVIATRAYDYRADLPEQTKRLLAYVEGGGTLIVEHQGEDWNPINFAPYAAAKPAHRRLPRALLPSHPLFKYPNEVILDNLDFRVTDEGAPVRLLEPEHPLFHFPNAIGEPDWNGWVQERGLYFWESWSEAYTPLVELADPGEEPQRGALLYARHGQGTFIYCGLALFRQVRAGVAGGVRLYVNLLSHRRLK
ncbi:MAG: PIG-L family deacetylase [Acidobacteria bacterium]|nr:PIG-L family deacetylase [Acidobacteriota bacterium]